MGANNKSLETSEFNENVKTELRHHRSLDEKLSALKITSDMYQHIYRNRNATVENFPEELLNQWQERLTATYLELNRNELLQSDSEQRDVLIQQRDALTKQLNGILDSTIWKVSSPLRKVLTLLKSHEKEPL